MCRCVNKILLVLCLLNVFHESYQDDDNKPDTTNSLGRGFGDEIEWVADLDTAFQVSKSTRKPLMLIIHKSWCGACKALKPKFRESAQIRELGKSIVMVNLEDDDEPDDEKFKPDGGYIPRILFFTPDGDFHTDIVGSNPNYKYFLATPDVIVENMKKAIAASTESRKSDEL